ncbi:hypothetical protein [Flavobacterium sp.]|uniref:hypothetical protein n=1 Tax=Flavobacterium sp. TaxID=239 RepID=UPI0038FBF754
MNNFFADIGYFILLINVILFIKGFSNNGKAFKIFTIYSVLIFIIQLIVNVLNYLKINNLFLSHFYFILQFFLLSFFYLTILKVNFQKTTIKLLLILCPLILVIQYLMDPNLFFEFNLFEIFITSFPIIIYSTYYLYNLLNEKKDFYYINLGILIYLFGSTVLFLVGNLVAKLDNNLNDIPWILNSALYIMYQLFILVEWKNNFSKKI